MAALAFLHWAAPRAAAQTHWVVETFAGGGVLQAVWAQVNIPNDVALDSNGNIYIADLSNHRIRKITVSTGGISTVAGTGSSGFSGDGSAATSATLNNPRGVAVDSAGNIYIADSSNNRIRKVLASSGIISTVAGGGTAGDGGQATAARLNGPYGLDLDSNGNIYIADRGNHRIRKVTVGTGVITTVAGTGTAGRTGDGAAATSARINNPDDVALDSDGNIYIADTSNNQIRKVTVTATTANISRIAGRQNGAAASGGDGGLAISAGLSNPRGIDVDSSGNIYIADTGNGRLRKITSGNISTVAGGGSSLGDGGLATAAQLNVPRGVAVDSSGNIYITDTNGHRVRKVMVSSGNIDTIAGTGTSGSGEGNGDGGAASSALLNNPNGIAIDSSGNLYIADYAAHRVRKVDAASGNIETIAGTGASGNTGDGSAATSATLNQPSDVAVDSAGNLYIADTGNRRVRMVNTSSNIVAFAGTGTAGSSGDGATATAATLQTPAGVAAASSNVYISDIVDHRVRRVSSGNIASFAGTSGSSGFSGDGAAATSAQLDTPYGMAVDSSGNVYIADAFNHRIRKVDTSGDISTVAGSSTGGFAGDGAAATSARLNFPRSVAADSAGNLYIADYSNHRIRKVDTDGNISTIAGTGTAGFSGDGGAAASAELNQPRDVVLDSDGNIYFSDRLNNRIRKLSLQALPPPPPDPDPDPDPGTGPDPDPTPEPTVEPVGVSELSFAPGDDAEPGGTMSQALTLRATGGAADYEVVPSARWIEISRWEGVASWKGRLAAGETITLRVTVNPLGLRAGTHRGYVYIRSGGRTARVRIVLEVPPPTGPDVSESGGVVNAARMSAYGEAGLFGPQILPLAPGSLVEVRGVNLASGARADARSFPLPTSLGGTRVLIGERAVPLLAVEAGSVTAQLPFAGLLPEGAATAALTVSVETEQGRSYPRVFHMAAQSPGIFTASGEGTGQGSIVFAGTADLAAPRGYRGGSRPARGGDVLEIYATGLGALEPPLAAGQTPCGAASGACGSAALRRIAGPVQVWIGGTAPAQVLFAGAAPTLAGVNVVLARVPSGIRPNEAAEVLLIVGGRSSQPGVTVAVE